MTCTWNNCQRALYKAGLCRMHSNRKAKGLDMDAPFGFSRPVAERAKAFYTPTTPDQCWEWQGARHRNGYGKIGTGGHTGGTSLAHRVIWAEANGPIPDGMVIMHACDNPPCVNPSHLVIGTQSDNMHDKIRKGRHQSS